MLLSFYLCVRLLFGRPIVSPACTYSKHSYDLVCRPWSPQFTKVLNVLASQRAADCNLATIRYASLNFSPESPSASALTPGEPLQNCYNTLMLISLGRHVQTRQSTFLPMRPPWIHVDRSMQPHNRHGEKVQHRV